MSHQNDWWASLNHGGLLIAPNKIAEAFDQELDALPDWRTERLRRELTRFDGTGEALSHLLDFILEDLSGLPAQEWQKAQLVDARWSLSSYTNEQIRPRRIWYGPNGEVLPVFAPEGAGARQFGSRLGVGRSRRVLSRALEWLRRMHQPVAIVTNGRQWRLIHAGSDYDAWCEWDTDLWFEEGKPSSQVLAWRQLVNRQVLALPAAGEPGTLVRAILDSRKGQAELSSVLGERVRQAVEELITGSHAAIEDAKAQGSPLEYRDLYLAGTRIVMRCIIGLFAEARGLLPVDNRIYHQAYSLDGLRQQLDRRTGGRGSERLAHGRSAWPRLVALFRLIYQGSAHEALPIPQYSGGLFRPGNAGSDLGMERALALLESPSNQISDKQVRQILRLLTRTKVRVRQGRRSTWVDGPVDFSALSSEYIGILYEGLLDYELKRADEADPIIFLSVGRQPALPLSRLEEMDDKAIKQLFEELKKKDKGPAAEDESEGGEEEEEADDQEAADDDEDAEAVDEPDLGEADEASAEAKSDEADIALSVDDLERAQAWLEKAAEVAGLVKKPRGRSASNDDYSAARRSAGQQLCARIVAPGQFYLVRWGGTRKGSGTFYTRPQLAGPTVWRTLRPLAFAAVRTEIDQRTGLDEVVEWAPRLPEEILELKVCDPAMGSGSFPAAALRFLTDALVQSLYHHQRIERRGDGAVARLADGKAATKISEQLLPLPPEHEAFEETLRAQLKRHVVERCIYGVDIDPLAVELGRLALWVETMDRTLPFGFLDHKLKLGNGLIGAWFDTFQEYPAMAWEREGGDSNHDRFVHHFHEVTPTRGKKAGLTECKGDVWTAAIKARRSDVQSQLIDMLNGQLRLGEDKPIIDVRNELEHVIDKLHGLPVHDTEARSRLYEQEILNNPRYHALKARMDLWCALWFWPGGKITAAPMPNDFAAPSAEALAIAADVARQQNFFHWELEFPDVFTPARTGFDALIGNPPWEIQKPNSKEFFSNIDPLYRAYGKQEALGKQVDYFTTHAEEEVAWLTYCADLKARSNWVKYAGQAFGDAVWTDANGAQKHDLNLGGRSRNGFEESAKLHSKWRKRRESHPCFADRAHPFLHQGTAADLNTYKMFLEHAHALLRAGGRLGMIVPSGIYTDQGSASLRKVLLTNCAWHWLFGFENRLGIFDIHRSFKFCAIIVEKGSATKHIRTAFMRRDVDDWNKGDHLYFPYSLEDIFEFSPIQSAFLELGSGADVAFLRAVHTGAVALDKLSGKWTIDYGRELHMTDDSRLFPPITKWIEKGFVWNDQIQLWANEDAIALPLYEGRMIGLFDHSAQGWISGKGRQAVWEDIGFSAKILKPQYLMLASDAGASRKIKRGSKLGIVKVSSATNTRSLKCSLIPSLPCGESVYTLQIGSSSVSDLLTMQAAFCSFIFDALLRYRFGGVNISAYLLKECPLPELDKRPGLEFDACVRHAAKLSFTSKILCPEAVKLKEETGISIAPAGADAALTIHERLRIRVILDALIAGMYGLDLETYKYVLNQCDIPADKIAAAELNPKGFWRVDKDRPPEFRHTVLSMIAYHDLQQTGLEAFLSQNDGDGWMIPETLRLADYGLGQDERAKEHQPVASQLGPRFFDWQLNEDIARSWEECEAHAELINSIVPVQQSEDAPAEEGNEQQQAGYQARLF